MRQLLWEDLSEIMLKHYFHEQGHGAKTHCSSWSLKSGGSSGVYGQLQNKELILLSIAPETT